MKTGFDMLESDKFNEDQIDFLRKTVSIMKVLSEEAMKTAEKFTKTCGRSIITGNDMYYALMYEAHEFFDKDIDDRFFREFAEEKEHSYETEDEEDDTDSVDDQSFNEDNEENYTIECKLPENRDFHATVLKYSNEWRNWFPEDPVKSMIKNAIDKTQSQIS